MSPKTRRRGTSKSRGASRLRTGLFIGGGVLTAGALVLAGTSIASALAAGDRYRTATVENASISETVDTSGTIASATRYDLAFQTDGTVASVAVAVGDTVTPGQKLATLKRSELKEAVAEAEQAVTDAKQTLAEDEEAQASGGTGAASSGDGIRASASGSGDTATRATPAATAVTATASTALAPGAGSGAAVTATQAVADPGGSGGTDPAVAAAMKQVTAAQAALLAKYEEVQGQIDSTDTIIDTATATCQVFLQAVLAEPAGDDSDGGDPGTDPGTAAGMTLEEAQAALEACQAQITQVQSGQAAIGEGQQAVQDLAADLDRAVTALRTAVEQAGSGSGSGSGSGPGSGSVPGGGSTPGAGSGSGTAPGGSGSSGGAPGGSDGSGASGGTTTVVTAEQLLADQAAIDLAEGELKIAQAQLAFSAITSPIDGTVAAVSIAKGDDVTAGSDSAVITVIGEDGFVAQANVGLNDIEKLALDQPVTAVVSATGKSYTGTVSSIGVLDVSTTSTPAFAVVVALDTDEDQLLNGGSAQLSIQTASVDDVLTVPTSAVHRDGATTTVNVLSGGEATATTVKLGAVGAERTEIASGLRAGQTVVLADLTRAIDSGSQNQLSGGLSGLGGSGSGQRGFGGAGGFSGGPPAGFTPPGGN